MLQVVESRPEGVLRTSYKYDLQKRLLKTQNDWTYPKDGTHKDSFLQEFNYDDSGKLIAEKSILNGFSRLVEYRYNHLGQLTAKEFRNPADFEKPDYKLTPQFFTPFMYEIFKYNMQGWETSRCTRDGCVPEGYFECSHHYYDIDEDSLDFTPSYTGNISAQWYCQYLQTDKYDTYKYDSQGRLSNMHEYTHSYRHKKFVCTDENIEKDIRYDLNGNILSMLRINGSSPDTLNFTYYGNRRAGADFEYDRNGNVTKDNLAGVEAKYNFLNLPEYLYGFNGPGYPVRVTYLSDGTKLATIQDEYWIGLYYAGPFVYSTDGMTEDPLLYASFTDGKITKDGDGYHTVYYVKDLLGSTRLEIVENDTIRLTYNYLPFGEITPDSACQSEKTNDNLFTGKEFQTLFDVAWYDSQARWLTTHGIFTSQDPLAESTPAISPYAYCANNPVNLVDPDGRKVRFAKGTSDEFKEIFAKTIQFMNERKVSYYFAQLEKSKHIYYISETSEKRTHFEKKAETIYWNPYLLIEFENGMQSSSTVMLIHEAAHALKYDSIRDDTSGFDKFKEEIKEGSDPQFGAKEERRVIMGPELEAAYKLGEIKKGQRLRSSHKKDGIKWIVLDRDDFKERYDPKTNSEAVYYRNELLD